MANNPSSGIKTESIDEVILRLLGLNPGTEIDYQTYFKILRNKLAMARMGGRELPEEEDILLRDELKRVKVIKEKGIRFKVTAKKTRVQVKAEPKPKVKKNQAKLRPKGEIVKYKGGLVPFDKIKPVDVQDVTEKKGEDKFTEIKKTLNSILSILSSKFKFDQKQSDKERRDKESERRGKRESTLEGFKKGITEIVGLSKKVLSPFKSIIDRIWKFIFYTLLGRAFTSFMEWLSDKENQKKFDVLIKFLTEHWPALVGIYVLFGTSFGKLVRGLIKAIVRTTIALAVNIPRIFAFIKKNKKLSFLGLGAATLASGYISKEVKNIFSAETPDLDKGLQPSGNRELDQAKKTADKAKETKVPQFNLGGMVPKMPTFNFGGMIPQIPNLASFAMGGLNPMSLQSGIPISGAGKDDTLIAAKTGEAILTEKDQSDLGQRYVDRKTGQPLNIPQYLSGRKPGFVNMSNLRFNGGGYSGGGRIQKFESGGVIGKASELIKKDEALSSLTPGKNDYIKPNGRSIISNINWNSLTPNTSIHSYLDSVKIPTIGWGSTYYDGILKGTKAVKMGDTISKKEADNLLNRNINTLAREYSRSIPTWSKMTPNQKSGLLSMGYNAPAAPIGAYPKLTQALKTGDWSTAAREMQRSGPNPERVRMEQRLIQDTTIPTRPKQLGKPKEPVRTPSTIERIREFAGTAGSNLLKFIGISGSQNKQSGGMINNSLLNINSLGGKSNNSPNHFGLVNENTGINASGETADRQLTLLQPGEFVLPFDTVNRLGVPFIEKLVALTDSNSEAYLKKGKVGGPNITPYRTFGSSGLDGMITLPPIVQSMSGNRARASGYAGGSKVPEFSVTAPNNDRAMVAVIYGLIESTV